jgi:hypothetical protein
MREYAVQVYILSNKVQKSRVDEEGMHIKFVYGISVVFLCKSYDIYMLLIQAWP